MQDVWNKWNFLKIGISGTSAVYTKKLDVSGRDFRLQSPDIS